MTHSAHGRQPLLHEELVVLHAPTQVWSSPTGDLGDMPIHGVFHADARVVDELRVEVGGEVPEPIGASATASEAVFVAVARGIDDGPTPDPRVRIERRRVVGAGTVVEHVAVVSALGHAVDTTVTFVVGVDSSDLQSVKSGTRSGVEATLAEHPGLVVATHGSRTLELDAAGADVAVLGRRVALTWPVHVPAHGSAEVALRLRVEDAGQVVAAYEGDPVLRALPATGDARLDRWAREALADLDALRMTRPGHGDEPFLAAGAPWFLTLFGRDTLIAARLLLPVDDGLALGTLRTLARLQGTQVDAASAEQPGKILHEIRDGVFTMPGEGIVLPPVYYGTVDATPLWIVLLHRAVAAGAIGLEDVRELRGTLEGALAWMRDHGDPAGTGFLHYRDELGTGLANQGWKDSGDSIRFHDGTIAEGPIALAEVQAQAHEAAVGGAELLDALDGDGAGDAWRVWAADLAVRFRDRFWVERDGHRFLAIALDGAGRPVDSRTSNMGQCIGTGILSAAEESLLAEQLVTDAFASRWGLRTMATDEGAFWPLSYHCGSVWPHDTGVVIEGMLRAGLHAEAAALAARLLDAAEAFGWRVPELLSGDDLPAPVAYPASCRPQAWSAAAVVPVARALAP
ncbi:glycogen debranching N-terminal domain-containing protein [Agrococcus versicolor]|uniref:Glycogen debranching N-terminal domain-containing protein n=1 Tax=Agrococcus versicolor TaxID=501482 RepID=A0ABN3AIU1_9MICO